MQHVTSKDGTTIAYETKGSGPALILVDGALTYRAFGGPNVMLAPLLSQHFTVFTYDRRGRGGSSNGTSYAIEREIEDIEALITEAGGSAFLYGISSGAVLALRAAAKGVNVRKLALFEPPLIFADSPPPVQPDRKNEIRDLVAAGRHGPAVKTFMRMVGMPGFFVSIMHLIPGVWPKIVAAAPTLPYDFAILGDTGAGKPMPAELKQVIASVRTPTLVVAGGKSPAWMHHTADLVAGGIPQATRRTLDGQNHNVSAKAIAPLLIEFFNSPTPS